MLSRYGFLAIPLFFMSLPSFFSLPRVILVPYVELQGQAHILMEQALLAGKTNPFPSKY